MNQHSTSIHISRVLGLLFLVYFLAPTASADIYIIVSANSPIQSMTQSELYKIYLGKSKATKKGVRIEPINQHINSSIYQSFNCNILGVLGSTVNTNWAKKVFSGSSTPPILLSNDATVEAFIINNKGYVGYISYPPKSDDVKTVLKVVD